MKKILLSVLAVAALASCVEDLGAGDAIDFGAPFVGNTTKAADPSYGAPQKDVNGNLLPESPVALTSFNVYGTVQGTGVGVVDIFSGEPVTRSVGINSVWTCTKTQYWIPGATYNFAAVVDAQTVGLENKLPKTLTPAKNGVYYKDMLYAFNGPIIAAAAAPYDKVNFAFEHLLAKAQFVVTSTTEGGYYYNVEGIKIQNIHTGAVYTVGTVTAGKDSGTWAGTLSDNVEDWFSLGNIEKITKANTVENAGVDKFMTNATQVLLIPTTASFKVSFTVRLLNDMGTDDTADDVELRKIDCTGTNAKEVSTGLVKGHAYNFNLALTQGTEILFTVEQHPTWATPSDDVNLGL